jgi:hypothetical protein
VSSVPAHVVLTPSDKSNLVNFMNLDNIGVSTVKDSTAFKKIQFFSKTNPTNLFNVKSDFQNSFNKINNLYLNDLDLNQSYTYGMDRQHTYTSLSSTLPMFSTLLDTNSITKFFNYNFNQDFKTPQSNLDLNRFSYSTTSSPKLNEDLITTYSKLLPNKLDMVDFPLFLKIPNLFSVLGAENDSKQYSNNFKFLLNFKHKKKNIQNLDFSLNSNQIDITNLDPSNNFSNNMYNTENTLKFKDYKSSNAQFLGSERTARLLNNLNSNSYKWNTTSSPNLNTAVSEDLLNYGNSQNYIYSSSLAN